MTAATFWTLAVLGLVLYLAGYTIGKHRKSKPGYDINDFMKGKK